MDDVLQELGQTPKQLVEELENDLVKLINKHSFMGVSPPKPSLSWGAGLCAEHTTAPCLEASHDVAWEALRRNSVMVVRKHGWLGEG